MSSYIDVSSKPTRSTDSSCAFTATINAAGDYTPTIGFDQTTPGTTNLVYSQDAGGIAVSRGIAGARFTSADQSATPASVTDAPTTGKKLVLTDIIVSTDTAMRVDIKEETTGTIFESIYMGAETTVNLVTRGKFKLDTINKKLQVQTSAAGNISVTPFYYSE